MRRRREREQCADRPVAHLRRHLQALLVGLRDVVEHVHRQAGLPERILRQIERHRAAGFLRQPPPHRERSGRFLHRVVEVVDELQHALVGFFQTARDAGQFVLVDGDGRRQPAILEAMQDRARGREPERAGLDALLHDRRHFRDIARHRRLSVGAAHSHHIDAHRRVRHLRREIDVGVALADEVEIFRKGLPFPGNAFRQHDAGNVLDPFHDADHQIVLIGPARRKADAAIPHHHRGDAVTGRRLHAVRPR